MSVGFDLGVFVSLPDSPCLDPPAAFLNRGSQVRILPGAPCKQPAGRGQTVQIAASSVLLIEGGSACACV